MKTVKLKRLDLDKRYTTIEPTIDVTVERDEGEISLKLPHSEELEAKLLDILLPEITNELNSMFEQLVGTDTPEEPNDEAFLSTVEEDDD